MLLERGIRCRTGSERAAALMQLFLVSANRNKIGLIQQDICCHQGRIGEQSSIDIVSVFRGFVLKLGHTGKFAELSVAV